MKVGWLLDGNVFDDYRDQLAEEVRRQGHAVQVVRGPKPGFSWDDVNYRQAFPARSCVVVHGEIELAARARAEGRWHPGAYGNSETLSCTRYFCDFGEFLLNGDYVMLPFGELSRCRDFLFDTLGGNGALFVRPDSSLKLFTGQVVRRDNFANDLEDLAFYEFPRESLVVVSSAKKIGREWRFVIVDHRVVAGSQYRRNGTMEIRAEWEPAAWDFAATIAARDFQPDPAWTIDVCENEHSECGLLEIGSFSFASLYACNLRDVVQAVSEVAWRDFETA